MDNRNFESGERVRIIETGEIVIVEYQDQLTKEVIIRSDSTKGDVALFWQEVEKI